MAGVASSKVAPRVARNTELQPRASDIQFSSKPLKDEVGVVYVVTNDYRYDPTMKLRDHGVDLNRIKHVFENSLDKYYVEVRQNRTRDTFINTLEYLAAYEKQKKYPPSCKRIIIYFAGHGWGEHITMEEDAKNPAVTKKVEISEMLSILRKIGVKMAKIILLDACCGVKEGICEEGSNELVACAASKDHCAESDPDSGGGYWTNELHLKLIEDNCDLVSALEFVKTKMKDKPYPSFDRTGKYVGMEKKFLPSFESGLLETVYFPLKGIAIANYKLIIRTQKCINICRRVYQSWKKVWQIFVELCCVMHLN